MTANSSVKLLRPRKLCVVEVGLVHWCFVGLGLDPGAGALCELICLFSRNLHSDATRTCLRATDTCPDDLGLDGMSVTHPSSHLDRILATIDIGGRVGKVHSMGTVVAGDDEDKGQGDETSNRNEKKQVMVILLSVLPRILRILTLCSLVNCHVDRDTSGEYVLLC